MKIMKNNAQFSTETIEFIDDLLNLLSQRKDEITYNEYMNHHKDSIYTGSQNKRYDIYNKNIGIFNKSPCKFVDIQGE